jgi:hypothetical protein
MWLQSAMNFYILATVRVKVVALSIEIEMENTWSMVLKMQETHFLKG